MIWTKLDIVISSLLIMAPQKAYISIPSLLYIEGGRDKDIFFKSF